MKAVETEPLALNGIDGFAVLVDGERDSFYPTAAEAEDRASRLRAREIRRAAEQDLAVLAAAHILDLRMTGETIAPRVDLRTALDLVGDALAQLLWTLRKDAGTRQAIAHATSDEGLCEGQPNCPNDAAFEGLCDDCRAEAADYRKAQRDFVNGIGW